MAGKYHRKCVTIAPGQRKTVYAKTKAELKEKIKALQAEIDGGYIVPSNKVKISDVADQWLPFHAKKTGIAESTQLSYATTIRRHIVPMFRKLPIQNLTEFAIITKMDGKQDLSSSTRRKILITLRLVVKFAKRQGIISKDPMEHIPLPRQVNVTDRDMHCMNNEQSRGFLTAIGGMRFQNLFTILLSTGMREGELFALSVRHIIDDYRFVQIRRTLSDDVNGCPQIRPQPKTSASRRTIPLPEIARAAVLSEMALRMREGRQGHDLLFSTAGGTHHRRQNVIRRHFRPATKKAGLTDAMTIHDLRHTYATLALNAGIGVHLISKMLGHASVSITIDLYGHALPDATAAAAGLVDDVLSGREPAETALTAVSAVKVR
ncbi:MAG TPA: site-specific integrase [Rhodospirillales bacterium]|nr:site-specific integrase [Rhodospirillales bacterium]